ncbi:MAG: F0F1 ATP synthase subunit gamma [Rhodospirillales bacterium]
MPSLKDLRVRITSVKSTQKITAAMKMVAAAKLRRAQASAEEGRPYALSMERMLAGLIASLPTLDTAPKLLSGYGADQKHLLVIVTADRGLCGGFNSNIVRETRRRITQLHKAGKDVQLLCIGRKGRDALRREYSSLIVDTLDHITRNGARFGPARDIARNLRNKFEAREFDVCTLLYNTFKSAMSQVVTAKQIIPFPTANLRGGESLQTAAYELEPDEDSLLETLLPASLSMQIFASLLESYASEQGARMTAMDNATRNAGDMINQLTLTYNRSRQAAITKELIEIISGAEAL